MFIKEMKIKKIVIGILTFSFLLVLSGLVTRLAQAIPPFARKYQTACPTCHVAIPKLNPFGAAFRANGYRIPGGADEVFTKDEPVLLGADPWKKMFPNTIWPSDIPGLPPIGVEVVTGSTFGFNEDARTEFTGIDEFAFLFGGTFGESWSFFGDVNLFKFSDPNIGWIDRMFIQYNPDWFGGKGHFNVRVGEIDPRVDGPFSNHRAIQIMSWFMGYLNTTLFIRTPDGRHRNNFGFFPNQKGVEAYGGFDGKSGGGLEYAVGIVNGEDAHTVDVTGGGSGARFFSDGRFDFNDQKDWYVVLRYKFGGMGVLGGGEVEELAATDNWQDNAGKWPSVKVGGYFYKGSNISTGTADLANESTDPDVDFIRTQADIDIFYGDFNIFGAWTLFRDRFDGGDDTTANVYTGEVDWVLFPWLIPVGKIEIVQSDFFPTFTKFTGSITALIRANIKFQAGVQVSTHNAPGTNDVTTPDGNTVALTNRVFEDIFAMGIQFDF